MTDYTIDGVDYTIDDRLDLRKTVEQIRFSKEHLDAQNTVGKAVGENVRGAITAAGDLAASVPGMIGAAPYGVAEAIKNGPKAGLEAFGEVSHAMNPLTEDFQYGKLPGIEALTPDRQSGAYENLNKPFEMMSQGWGNIAGGAAHVLGASPETAEQVGAAGELGLGVGMAGLMAKGGVDTYRNAKEAGRQKQLAADMLERKLKGEQEYASWDTSETSAANAKALQELDAIMSQYGKNLQAPQLGLGGKVARHEDQVGKRTKGEYTSQMTWDEDMFKASLETQAARDAAHEQALQPGVDQLGQYGPTYAGETLDHAPAPVRPYQVEQTRTGVISEGEATNIYRKPAFERTVEDRLKLKEYEDSLKGPSLDAVASERRPEQATAGDVTLDRTGEPNPFPYKEGGNFREFMRETLDRTYTDAATRIDVQLNKIEAEQRRQNNRISLLTKRLDDPFYNLKEIERQIQSSHERLFELNKESLRLKRLTPEYLKFDKNIPKDLPKWANEQLYDRDGNPINFPYMEGGYAFTDFKKDLAAKGVKISDAAAKAMFEKQTAVQPKPEAHPNEGAIKVASNIPGLDDVQRQYADTRPYEEIQPDIEKAGDVSTVKSNIVAKIVQGKFTALEHPVWSWVSSQIHWSKNNSTLKSNARMHGEKGSRNLPQEGSYNYIWKQLTKAEREGVNKVGWELNSKDTYTTKQELQAKGLNPKQIQAWQDRVRINKDVLREMNEVLKAENKEPIHQLPNYWSPNEFKGPFLLIFIDKKTGNKTKIVSSYLRPNEKKLQQHFPDHKLEVVEKGLKGELDFDQLEWVLRQLSKEQRDPAAKAIAEGLRRQGFMRHGLKRGDVEGGLGSTGKRALREYEETSERYIRKAYDWMSNRELDKLYNKILDDKGAIDKQPYAKGFALEAIDQARGGANATMEGLSRILGEIVRGGVAIGTLDKMQLPQRFLRDVVRGSNKFATIRLLGFGNLTNLTAQLLQHTFAYPKMLELAVKKGYNSAQVMAATFKATAKAHNELIKGDSSIDIKKLDQIGTFDATFQYDWSTYASDSDPRFKAALHEHMTGISLLSKVESDAVRKPAALLFLNQLRELGYKGTTPDEIFYVAKEMTDQYMVSTKWHEKPHMFGRTGLVGTTLSPFQSFATTWVGMLREYSKLSAQGLLEGSLAKQLPLGAFMAISLLTSGLTGLIGIKEWDAAAYLVNKWFGYNIPGGTEYIMSKFKDKTARFGLLSSLTGMNIGATFNAPTITGSFAPGLQQLAGGVDLAQQLGREALAPTGLTNAPTSVEKREALKQATPRFSPLPGFNWGDIEKKFTPEGLPYQDTAGNAGPVTRDKFDETARRLGTYSLKEAEEKTTTYIMKKEGQERSQRLSKTMNQAVDILLSGGNLSHIEPLIRQLEQDRFSGNDIKLGLKREILSKILESDTRMMGKGQSSKQQYLINLYQQLR